MDHALIVLARSRRRPTHLLATDRLLGLQAGRLEGMRPKLTKLTPSPASLHRNATALPSELTGGRRGALRAIALVIALAGLVGAFMLFHAPVGFPLWAGAATVAGGFVLLRPRRSVTHGGGFALFAADLIALTVLITVAVSDHSRSRFEREPDDVAVDRVDVHERAHGPESALARSAALIRVFSGLGLVLAGSVLFRLERRAHPSPLPTATARRRVPE
jgi:hypothetical protein